MDFQELPDADAYRDAAQYTGPADVIGPNGEKVPVMIASDGKVSLREAAEPERAAPVEPIQEAKTECAAEPKTPKRMRMPDGRYALEGTAQPQTRRLKVCGYIGDAGRVYAIEGSVIKIAGLAGKYTPGELRILQDELAELLEAIGERGESA